MPRGIRKAKPAGVSPAVPSIQDRIRDAERQVAAGLKESVVVDQATLERVLLVVVETGQTKAQILKKAVVLGLDVLTFKPDQFETQKPMRITEAPSDPIPWEGQYNAELDATYTLRRGPSRFPDPVESDQSAAMEQAVADGPTL
jgi:hypothetical protein